MAAALLFAGCANTEEDWADPMHNGDEGVKTVALNVQKAPAIDFANVTTDNVKLFEAKVEVADSATVTYDAALMKADKTDTVTLKADAEGQVAAEELKSAVETLYGKRPVAREIPLEVSAYVNINGQAVKAVGNTTATVTLVAPVIENAYYVYGTPNNWSKTDKTYKLENGGGDVYDDPVFTITVPAPKDASGNRVDLWFKIAPESAYGSADFDNAGIIGASVDGDKSLTGSFVNKDSKAFMQPKDDGAKYYKLEFNMLDGTYAITPMNDPELFLTGSNYGWGGEWKQLTPVNGTTDTFWTIIYLHADEEFKFAPQAGWGNDFGSQATISDNAGAGITASGTNLKATKAGWYLLKVVNGAAKKLDVLKPEVYLFGDVAGGKWEAAKENLFTVPSTDNGEFVSPAFTKNGDVRMCVVLDGYDWWKTEFVVTLGGKIDYRGKGGDQNRVAVKAGQKAYLNFAKGTGSYR